MFCNVSTPLWRGSGLADGIRTSWRWYNLVHTRTVLLRRAAPHNVRPPTVRKHNPDFLLCRLDGERAEHDRCVGLARPAVANRRRARAGGCLAFQRSA